MTLYLPALLQAYANGKKEITVESQSVDSCLMSLIESYPLLKPYILDADGCINSFLNVYVNGKDIRSLDQEKTHLEITDRVDLVLSVAGG